jgi:hypothetical protein
MVKISNMMLLMLLPPAITAAALVYVAYFPNPMI